MFVGMDVPVFDADIIDNEVNSFYSKESKLLSLVQNKQLVAADKLPTSQEIKKMKGVSESLPGRIGSSTLLGLSL